MIGFVEFFFGRFSDIPFMIAVTIALHAYIRNSQAVRITKYYSEYAKHQEEKTQRLTRALLRDISSK